MKPIRLLPIAVLLPAAASTAAAQVGLPIHEILPVQDIMDGALVNFEPSPEDAVSGVPEFSFDQVMEVAPTTVEEVIVAQSALSPSTEDPIPLLPPDYADWELPDLYGLQIGRAVWSKAQGEDKYIWSPNPMSPLHLQSFVDAMNDAHTAKSMGGAGITTIHKYKRLTAQSEPVFLSRIDFDGEGALNVLGYEVPEAVRFDGTIELRRGEFLQGTASEVASWEGPERGETSFHVELAGQTVVDESVGEVSDSWIGDGEQLQILDVRYPTSIGPVEVELNFQGGAECAGKIKGQKLVDDNIPGVGACAEVKWNVYANGGLEVFPLGGWKIVSVEFKLEMDILGDNLKPRARAVPFTVWGQIQVLEEALRAFFKVKLHIIGTTHSKQIFEWGTGSDSEEIPVEQTVGI